MKRLGACFLVSLAVATAAELPPPAEMMRGAQPRKPARPVLVVGVNSLAAGVAEPGWPVIVSVAVVGKGTVPAQLEVRMTDERGQPVALPFDRRGDCWIADEAATKALAPGRYRLSLAPVDGWRIDSGELVVGPADADPLPLLKIQRAVLVGKDDEALAEAARNPENMDALIARGDILLSKDLPDEALAAYDQALKLRGEKDGESYTLSNRRRAAFFRSLEKRGVLPAHPVAADVRRLRSSGSEVERIAQTALFDSGSDQTTSQPNSAETTRSIFDPGTELTDSHFELIMDDGCPKEYQPRFTHPNAGMKSPHV